MASLVLGSQVCAAMLRFLFKKIIYFRFISIGVPQTFIEARERSLDDPPLSKHTFHCVRSEGLLMVWWIYRLSAAMLGNKML